MRVLVTGIGTFWGSRVAQELESRPDVEMVVGLGAEEPVLPLERTEYVRSDSSYSILQRLVHATQVDTILHTHLIVDSTQMSGRSLHEINVIGTMNLLAAAGSLNSPVTKLVVKSSTLVYGANRTDPYFFREGAERTGPPRTRVERSLVEVGSYVRDFAADNPHVLVTELLFTNVMGDHMATPFSKALRMRMVPEILGFDPLLQFTHEDDVTGALIYSTVRDAPGAFNVAGDGTITWSEVARMARKRRFPLPPVLTGVVAEPLRMLGWVDLPEEMLDLLRYGRGVDNSRFKATGFRYRFTTVSAVDDFLRGMRLEATIGERQPSYRYEQDVESFFRHSPAVLPDRQ